MKNTLLAAGLSIFAATASQGSVIVAAVDATASSTFGATYDADRTIDQSGLDINYVSGVTDFDAYIGLNPIHTLVASNNEWFSEIAVTSATLVFDLGQTYHLDRLALWNEEAGGFADALVSGSVDNVTYASLTTIDPTNNPTGSDYGAEVFSLGGPTYARYIKLDLDNCPQPSSSFDGCSMGEIAFSAVPIPGAALFLLSGIGGLAAVRKRVLG